MLCDENEDIRRRTATCIGWLGREELAVELVPLLDDSSVSVRLAVVEAMSNLHSREVVSALIGHLNDLEKTVRKAIISALETITGKKMSGSFPRDEKSFQILIIRWAQWWKDENKVLCQI
jgi:HEAT repeat protein